MKNSVYIIICFLFLSASGSRAGSIKANKPDSSFCLEIEGKILNAHEGIEHDCTVELLVDDEVVDSIILKGNKRKFKFDLKRNLHYTIRLTKKGYITKSVCIRTNLPTSYSEVYQFVFETRLEEISLTKEGAVKEEGHAPVARIFFDQKKECFYYSKAHPTPQKDLCTVAH
jgi:hypothetical protein